MPRKIIYCIMLIVCSSLLSGCNQVMDLTEQETSLIAEYTAELLLKYDRNYTDRIDDGENVLSEVQEISGEEKAQETIAKKNTEISAKNNSASKEISKKEEVSISSEENLAKNLEIDGITITCKDYLLTDKYPVTDEQGEFIHLDAAEGYQLLVLRFDVINTTEESITFSLLKKEIDYRVVCNGSLTAKAMLTILLNDLGTMETTVNPDEKQEAVLVFQIADDIQKNLDSVELKMNYNNIENSIMILE